MGWRLVILLLLVMLVLAACAAGTNSLVDTESEDGVVAGFWRGLWQGIITPFTFIISLFTDDVNVYEVHNNGGWYNFGFLLGVSVLLGGGSSGAATRRRR